MTEPKVRDPDWISRREARAILGVTDGILSGLIRGGRVSQAERISRRFSRDEVEKVALEVSDWVTTADAAEILGVRAPAWVNSSPAGDSQPSAWVASTVSEGARSKS